MIPRSQRAGVPFSKRARGVQRNERLPFVPPEDWHEPEADARGYRFVVQKPGEGYQHVVTRAEVTERLSQLPVEFVEPLRVVQFSGMTRKKKAFPCYGMQWGSSVYLYPLEENLTEYYSRPPKPAQWNEARMYGGRWVQDGPSDWRLIWTLAAAKDFYLNNILIHELGHLLDERNSSSIARERFAEWFAIAYGYRPTAPVRSPRRVIRRHHAC